MTVTNCSGVKLNMGEGGEDFECPILSFNGDLKCLVTK